MEKKAGIPRSGATHDKKRGADRRWQVSRNAGLGASGPPRLSPEEEKAERIFFLTRRGLGRAQYLRAMQQLEETREGRIAACYCTWLALREVPVCPESWGHWNAMRARLADLMQ